MSVKTPLNLPSVTLGCSGGAGQAQLWPHKRQVWNQGLQNWCKSLKSAIAMTLHTRFRYKVYGWKVGENSLKSTIGHVRVLWWFRASTVVTSQDAGMKSRAAKSVKIAKISHRNDVTRFPHPLYRATLFHKSHRVFVRDYLYSLSDAHGRLTNVTYVNDNGSSVGIRRWLVLYNQNLSRCFCLLCSRAGQRCEIRTTGKCAPLDSANLYHI